MSRPLLPTADDVERARDRIRGRVRWTPLEETRGLHDAYPPLLKLECFQDTGSFKVRGAWSKLLWLEKEQLMRGVVAASAGNHALAVASATEKLGVPATLVVPENTVPAKLEALQRTRAEVLVRGADYEKAEGVARALGQESGRVFLSPYNDPQVIAGQGTIAHEILEEAPDVDAIVVPVGGGGLVAGIALAAKELRPGVRIVGAEPAHSPKFTAALEAGRLVPVPEKPSLADALSGNVEPTSITFELVQTLVDDVIVIEEEAIRGSIRELARHAHLMAEGSAAIALAAVAALRPRPKRPAVVISGRNIDLKRFIEIVSEG